jgi:phage baseplate assembly protein W
LDIWQQWGADLLVGPSGDLATVSGPAQGTQKVLRRLLTSPGDYVWQPTYGAGLAQLVGRPVNPLNIRAIIRAQIFQEPAVARSPEPTITVIDNNGGDVYVQIQYVDADTGESQALSFSVSG